MIVQDTLPASLPPAPSLPDETDEVAPASAFAQLLNMFSAPPTAANTPLPASANDPEDLVGAGVMHRDDKLLSVSALPELATSAPLALASADSFAVPQTLIESVLETGENAASAAMLQESAYTQSTDAAEALPVTTARHLSSNEEPRANDTAETGSAASPQESLSQTLVGVSLPSIFDASASNALIIQTPQIGSSLSEFSGRAASATGAAAEAQTVARLNVASKDLPTAVPKAPAAPLDDLDGFQLEPIRALDQASVAPADLSPIDVPQAHKRSDGLRDLPFTERTLEIASAMKPVTPGAADGTTVMHDADKSRGIAAVISSDGAGKDGWDGQPGEGDPRGNLSMLVGSAPVRIDEPQRGETPVPAWRPIVERLAQDIGERFRVGERQAVLQLEPPELGKVKIDLRIEGGQLHVRIAAAGYESQELIEHHLPELHQVLRAGQIDVGEVRVTHGEWTGGGALAQNFSQSPHGRQETPGGLANAVVGDEAMTEHLAQPARNADGRVSMWA